MLGKLSEIKLKKNENKLLMSCFSSESCNLLE